jgi:VIT1/CCC1 family predicted Fe2+/Mn2+ transporter/rubrerythrin
MAQVGRDSSVGEIAQANWLSEMECIGVYNALLEREKNPMRRSVIQKLGQAEEKHARLWENLLIGEGLTKPPMDGVQAHVERVVSVPGGSNAVLQSVEAEERKDVAEYTRQLREVTDERLASVLREIIPEEHSQALILRRLHSQPDASSALNRILRRERRGTGSWIGDAVYGVNDGLGAIFGIVSGVSGATLGNSKYVLLAGLAGMIASALSMGAGAYLAAKSERELFDAELFHEKQELELHSADAKEEMSLFYQLKGIPEDEADKIVDRLASHPEQFLRAMAAEKLNLTEEALRNPVSAAVTGSLSTAVGAFIPVIPFFFMAGYEAVLVAAIISILAHFAVGAAKSLVTVRSWWASGFEMTMVGIIEGAVTYALGLALGHFGGFAG